MRLNRKDLLGIKELDVSEINLILDTADSLKEVLERDIKKVPTLRGKTIVNLFYEPSTRTRTSFEIAGKTLSADVINITTSTSSIVKGESLIDTAKNIEALNADILIVRHSASGAPHLLAKNLKSSVINAGDGAHEHPTQALLDVFTIRERKKSLTGLTVTIVGDIMHSRVARSNIYALKKLGADVRIVGPPTMLPKNIEELGVKIFYNIEKAVDGVDVIMMLRLQLERQGRGFFPSIREYSRLYCLTEKRVRLAKEDVLIMHPGPMNRGVEIEASVADGPYSVILDQVTNGLAIRMAVLYLLAGVHK